MKRLIFSGFLALVPRSFFRASTATTMSTFRHSSSSSSSGTTLTDSETMQEMIYRVRQVNNMPDEIRKSLFDFQVDGVTLGKVRPATADMLCSVDVPSPVFQMSEDVSAAGTPYLTFAPSVGPSAEERTRAVALVTEHLRDQGTVRGWRDELFPVAATFYESPCFLMERAAVTLLGVLEYGVHINGLVHDNATGETKMWIARRSATKSKYPGMLDHIVAGGQPAGMSLMDNVVKECLEEAGIPEELTRAGIQPTGGISYETLTKDDTVTRAVMFVFDLHLPADFQPVPVDGEAQDFSLWTIDEIIRSLPRDNLDPIKPNCYSVIIDFLLRKGYVSPDTPGYLDVLRELRSGDCQ